MGVDFKVLKEATRAELHCLTTAILNEVAPFRHQINPTAENMRAYLFQRWRAPERRDQPRLCHYIVGNRNALACVTPRINHDKARPQPIADVQGSKDTAQYSIDKVGIKDIRHPVRVRES